MRIGEVVGVLVAVVGVLILFSQHPSSSSTIQLINKELQQRFGISFSQRVMTSSSRQRVVVVVGGGLAGMSAALEAEKLGAKVLLFDKEKKLGGNSAKASSGINAVGTLPQQTAGIQDSIQTFIQDTLKSGHGLCNEKLVEVLVKESASAIDFLTQLGLELTTISQCGGHSRPRTLRGKPAPDGSIRNVGWEIVSTLEKQISANPNIIVSTSHKLISLLLSEDHQRVTGIKVTNLVSNEVLEVMADAVVLASGGFGFDRFGLISKYAPQLKGLPTTNGPWAMGEGVLAAEEAGAELVLMDQVQVHPTGFVDPKDPKNPTKFLAPEALRGSGAIMVNSKGLRFVNELGLRDQVTQAIFQNCQKWDQQLLKVEEGERLDTELPTVAYSILNDQAVDLFHRPVLTFYHKRGLVQRFENVEGVAEALKMEASVLRTTIEQYAESAKKGVDEFGKKTYPVVLSPDEPLYVAVTTPAIHYTMGGVAIDVEGRVLRKETHTGQEEWISGLFAAGEVSGGVHGANRLAGNSLLECVVFGRRAGRNAVTMNK